MQTPALPHVPLYALPPIPKQEAEACRHKAEKCCYRLLVFLNISLIAWVLITVIYRFAEYVSIFNDFYATAVAEALRNGTINEGYYEQLVQNLPLELRLFLSGILTLIILLPVMYYFYASVRASAVKITKRNFPEVYAMIESYAKRLGMKKVPEAYIMQQNGILNAFSTYLFRRQYIVFHTEVFEVAYREHHDMEALGFIAAHELSHIYYGHATFSYNLWILFSQMLPVIGPTASRTREYSCDRLAQHLTQNDGIEAMLMLMVDRHLYKMVDKVDYLEQAKEMKGFFLWVENLLSTHPIMPKRIRALAVREGSGELF